MVCVPIVPVGYDTEDPVLPNGRPCEIWRNVDDTEHPIEHVAALFQAASSVDASGPSIWNLDGTLSAEAKVFITSSCKLCPDMNWGEMRTKLDSHFKQRVSLGPSNIMKAANGFFKRTKKAVAPSSSADLLKGGRLNDTLNFLSQNDIFFKTGISRSSSGAAGLNLPDGIQCTYNTKEEIKRPKITNRLS